MDKPIARPPARGGGSPVTHPLPIPAPADCERLQLDCAAGPWALGASPAAGCCRTKRRGSRAAQPADQHLPVCARRAELPEPRQPLRFPGQTLTTLNLPASWPSWRVSGSELRAPGSGLRACIVSGHCIACTSVPALAPRRPSHFARARSLRAGTGTRSGRARAGAGAGRWSACLSGRAARLLALGAGGSWGAGGWGPHRVRGARSGRSPIPGSRSASLVCTAGLAHGAARRGAEVE